MAVIYFALPALERISLFSNIDRDLFKENIVDDMGNNNSDLNQQ